MERFGLALLLLGIVISAVSVLLWRFRTPEPLGETNTSVQDDPEVAAFCQELHTQLQHYLDRVDLPAPLREYHLETSAPLAFTLHFAHPDYEPVLLSLGKLYVQTQDMPQQKQALCEAFVRGLHELLLQHASRAKVT